MARYSIADTTLTALGDAVRSKVGETEIRPVAYDYVVQSANATGFGEENIGGPYNIPEVIITVVTPYTFAGATTITVKIGGIGEYNYYQVKAHSGVFTDNASYPSTGSKSLLGFSYSENGVYVEKEVTFTDTDSISIHENLWDSASQAGRGYYLEIRAYDADGNPIPQVVEKEVKKTMTPERMVDEVDKLAVMDPSLFDLSGDVSYKFYHGAWDGFINLYGNNITTKDITNLASFLQGSKVTRLPFEINCVAGKGVSLSRAFADCQYLQEPPILHNCQPTSLESLFNICNDIREFPEGYGEDWDWSWMDNQTGQYNGYKNGMLNGCRSLRKLPMGLFKHGNPNVQPGGSQLRDFQALNCLDEVIGMPFPHKTPMKGSGYSGWFYNSFGTMTRLKDFTFAADIGPMQWANQTIDFSNQVGYLTATYNENHIANDYSGITTAKKVTDDASYQALKDDPDWYTLDLGYSRYNHDSAVNTINSLPDCSEYAAANGTNIIKFKGAAGEKTDGGAINTLTDEEIAVAAAKGWTVTLV